MKTGKGNEDREKRLRVEDLEAVAGKIKRTLG